MKIEKKAVYEARYPRGTIVELTADIDDPYTPKKAGDRFRVSGIDDALQLHGSWFNGGSMAIDIEQDSFRVVFEDEL